MSTPSRQEIMTVEHTDKGVAIVTFGTLTQLQEEQKIASIGERLMDLVVRDGVRQMLIDFAQIRHMSSVFLGRLIILHKRLTLQFKGTLILAALAVQILEVFQITRLDVFFKIAKDRDAALAMF